MRSSRASRVLNFKPDWVLFRYGLAGSWILNANAQNAYKMVTEHSGHQIALMAHHFNKLSVNETGTYGFHCPKNTQGFKIKANKGVPW